MNNILVSPFKDIANTVIVELETKYLLKAKLFFDSDFMTARSCVISPNIIVLDMKHIPDMVVGIRAICHEYCHLLREYQAKFVPRLQEIHDFFLKECHEYYDHEPTVQGRLIYQYSLLEPDAQAFEETFGTVCTDCYFLLLSVSQLREAYARKGVEGLVSLIRKTYHL